MLTQKLQRRFAEEEATIKSRMGTKQLLQELIVGELSSVFADTFVTFGSLEFAVRIGCSGQPSQVKVLEQKN